MEMDDNLDVDELLVDDPDDSFEDDLEESLAESDAQQDYDGSDEMLLQEINALSARLKAQERKPAPARTESVPQLRKELDRLWDLRRRRDARRAAGDVPPVSERPASVVESYVQ